MNRTVYQPMRSCGCRTPAVLQHVSPDHPKHGMHGSCTPQPAQDTCPVMHEQILAMAYVQIQTLGELYDPCTALIAGTLFPALDKPFCGETVSASAYPNPPARTCDCAMPIPRDRCSCGCERGGDHRD